ncbi:MAG: nickel-dependent lactate racemase [Anaerolineaceae bacterium]|nr:nickel-dependent lactate racemase [Anaerolineaceae bacterium]
MQKIDISYGRDGLKLEVPDNYRILQTNEVDPLEDEQAGILTAIRFPTGKAPLARLVSRGTRVVITHSDITRATPNNRLLPVILNELEENGVCREDITLLNALGTHRQQTNQELRALLGAQIVENYRCEQHNAFNDEGLISVGKTSFGNDIRLNKTLVKADLKIFTGFIEPHFFAGFSGGPKAVLPALAGAESVYTNHSFRMISHPSATFNITQGNPIWEEMKEASEKVSNSFLVNVTLDRLHRITGVFAGDVISAHSKGCQYLRDNSVVTIEEPFDIVITSNSGYPLDQNLYQCVKGLSAAKRGVRKGGAILMVARCEDGLPDHGCYASLLQRADSPKDILSKISQPGFHEQDTWQVQTQAYVQQHAEVHLFSEGLQDTQIKNAMMIPCHDIDNTVSQLKERFGNKVCVIPEGPLVIVNQSCSNV